MRSCVIPIIRKEIIHIIRDSRSLAIIFIFPLLMILLYGYGITFDIKNINLAIVDYDKTFASRELMEKITNTEYFSIKAQPSSAKEIYNLFLQRKVVAAIVISKDYGKSVQTNAVSKVQLIIDGSNANTAIVVKNYIAGAIASYSLDKNITGDKQVPMDVLARIWYNPDLKSSHFVVPGLVAILMMMICAMLTSITITREKETGTMEQILVSPIRPFEIIVGKVTPYIFLAFSVATMVIVCARLIFNVPFRGNVAILAFFTLLFIYASLSLGVFISSRTRTQQASLMISLVGTLLPSVLLSGFVFPVNAMPVILRMLSNIVPAKYYLIIIRGIMLKGIGFNFLIMPGMILFIFGTLLLFISGKRFKTNLEG